jgi:hypothetical protein
LASDFIVLTGFWGFCKIFLSDMNLCLPLRQYLAISGKQAESTAEQPTVSRDQYPLAQGVRVEVPGNARVRIDGGNERLLLAPKDFAR